MPVTVTLGRDERSLAVAAGAVGVEGALDVAVALGAAVVLEPQAASSKMSEANATTLNAGSRNKTDILFFSCAECINPFTVPLDTSNSPPFSQDVRDHAYVLPCDSIITEK